MQLSIQRIDYKNPAGRGFYSLPSLTDVNEITDVNVVFETVEAAEAFALKFPKAYRPHLATLSGVPNGNGGYTSKPFAYIKFNTFYANKTTGAINEAAVAKRVKFLKKLAEIL